MFVVKNILYYSFQIVGHFEVHETWYCETICWECSSHVTGYRDAAVQKMVIIEAIKACDGHTKAVESGASTAIEIYIDDILCTSIICVYVGRWI